MAYIKPTVGRIVWFHSSEYPDPMAAIIARVLDDDRYVNLCVSDPLGKSFGRTDVPLIQEGEAPPAMGWYCEWMPYQKGQATKTEALENQLKVRNV